MPAAIAAPTPVSSLVHSSTLVTAGVYLVIRYYYILRELLFKNLFCILAIRTSLLSGMVACVEPDLKKVVAISTLRQLGLILYVISLGEMYFCYFHIVCHALFKALLFLSCGIIIYLRFGGQDRRFIGRFSILNPTLRIIFSCSSIRLFGIPFLAGFYSKDAIIEVSILYETSLFIYLFLFLSCVLTITYRIRLFQFSIRNYRLGESLFNYKSTYIILVPIIFLLFWSIVLGKLFSNFIFFCSINFIFLPDKLLGILVLIFGLFFFLKKI